MEKYKIDNFSLKSYSIEAPFSMFPEKYIAEKGLFKMNTYRTEVLTWMDNNIKKVLDTREYNRFISLLKDVAPYQLKIDQANGCTKVLDNEEIEFFQQLKNELKAFYDKLEKAWFF
jgi:hypothetical protein